MFHKYTKCYQHTPGDKPFNKDDLASFAAGASAPGLVGALLAFLSGAGVLGFIIIGAQYAVTITAVAKEWLNHRLCCLPGGDQCAVGTWEKLNTTPENLLGKLGSFDNDYFFDIRLMPHRFEDEYGEPNTVFNTSAGPSLDGWTETHPDNDIFRDGSGSAAIAVGFPGQGQTLVRPFFSDLPYKSLDITQDKEVEAPAFLYVGAKPVTNVTRCTLHCEVEGNFWDELMKTAVAQGVAVGAGAAGGAAVGAAVFTAVCLVTCGVGCVVATVVGAIAGGLGGAAGAAYLGASAAFNSDPGDLNDANVGDDPLSGLGVNDHVVVFGTHVYDGFHTGWHEFHPLKAIIKAGDPKLDPKLTMSLPYVEWNPGPGAVEIKSAGLTVDDVQKGLASADFTKAAKKMKDSWCSLLTAAFSPVTTNTQGQSEHRWTIHPAVDGCSPNGAPLPPPPLN
jgi:hypothetical protein